MPPDLHTARYRNLHTARYANVTCIPLAIAQRGPMKISAPLLVMMFFVTLAAPATGFGVISNFSYSYDEDGQLVTSPLDPAPALPVH